jgi:hypothetical protein
MTWNGSLTIQNYITYQAKEIENVEVVANSILDPLFEHVWENKL